MSLKQTFKNYSKRDLLLTKILAGVLLLSVFVITIGLSINNYKMSNKSNEYTESLVGDYEGINPIFPQSNKINDQISYLIFEGLTKYNPQKKQIEQNLASFSSNPDSTRYIYNLKSDLQWSDGEALTVDDVLFTYKNIFQHPKFQNDIIRTTFQSIQINQISETEIEFILPNSNSFFPTLTTLPILPKHIHKGIEISELEPNSFTTKELIGNGPYILKKDEELKKGVHRIVLTKNKNYFKKEPNIKTVEFLIYPDITQALESQENINTYANITQTNSDQLEQSKFQFKKFTLPQYTSLFINSSKPILDKKYIRESISKSIDKESLQQSLKDKKIIQNPIFFFSENNYTKPDHNAIRASIEENGFSINGEGAYQREDEVLIFNLVYPAYEADPDKQEEVKIAVNKIKSNLNQSGIIINSQAIPNQLLNQTILQKEYDLLLFGQDLGIDLDLYQFWHSSQSGQSKLNLSNYQNNVADNIINSLRRETNPETKIDLINQIHQNFQNNYPAVFLYSDYHTFAFDNKVKNRNILEHYSSTSDRFYDIYLWTVE